MKTCKFENCTYPVFSHGYCKIHQYARQDKPVISNTINNKKTIEYRPKKKYTGELDLFKEIWDERKHVSEISGKPVLFDPKCFHHILTKGAYPELRLNKDNIIILTKSEHNDIHSKSLDDLIKMNNSWNVIYEKREKLIRCIRENTTECG